MFKNIVSFALGLALGGTAGYLYAKKKLEKEAQAEIDAYKKEKDRRNAELCPDKIEVNTIKKDEEEGKVFASSTVKPDLLSMSYIDDCKAAKDIVNYSGYSAKEDNLETSKQTKKAKEAINKRKDEKYKNYKNYDAEEELEDEDSGFVDAFPSEGPREDPYSITPEQFASENPYFDKITLMYYEGDDTLTDEDENIINNEIADTVGMSFRALFGEYEDNVAYIRNEKTGADYEILYNNTTFS